MPATGYVPALQCQVKVVFIPKPRRGSHSGPKDFRLISHTLFLLNAMEKLVDKFLTDKALALMPLHPNQHDYQAGKSIATALHQVIAWVEKALDQQETAMDVFLDTEGVFNNTSYDSMCGALVRQGVRYTVVQ